MSYAFTPSTVLDDLSLSRDARLLFTYLASYTTQARLVAYPSQATLAERMGCGERHVRDCLTELEERQHLQVQVVNHKGGRRNVYTLNFGTHTIAFEEGVRHGGAAPGSGTAVPHPPGGSGTVVPDGSGTAVPEKDPSRKDPSKKKDPRVARAPICTERDVFGYMLELGAPERIAGFEATKFIGYYFGVKARELKDWRMATRGWLTRARERDQVLDRAMGRKVQSAAPLLDAADSADLKPLDPEDLVTMTCEAGRLWQRIDELYRSLFGSRGAQARGMWVSGDVTQGALGRLPTLRDIRAKVQDLEQRLSEKTAA